MTKLQWFFLWLLFICYLFMGATFFYLIERHLEDQRKADEAKEREEIYDLLEYHLMGDTPYAKKLILDRISNYCEKPIYKLNETDEDVPPEHFSWSFYNSFFFSLTTISTVGYGNISPSSNKGRLLVIFYSLIGTPFAGIVLAQLGEFFGSVFLRAHNRYKNRVYDSCFPLIMDIIVYLVPGLLIIIIVPALMFSHFEEWDMIMSIYYAYVTLTTIGFGDLVAGQREVEGVWYNYIYKPIIIIWVMFGLGYLVMVMGFLARGLTSKKVHQIEHKLASTIKQTRAKIWNEFVQDVTSVRSLLNEMYLLKVKRVYVDKEIKVGMLGRSKSCPNFSSWPVARREHDDDSDQWIDEDWDTRQAVRRRRAYSEHHTGFPYLVRGVSESHLDLIDKDATFDNQSIQTIQSKQIFAKAVDAAISATSNQSFDTGVNCFSDDEILASEREFRRNRAMSYDVSRFRDRLSVCDDIYKRRSDSYSYNHQNTWSGTDTLRPSILKNISIDGRNDALTKEKEDTKAFETAHSSASSLRRMSTAAMNFFNINNMKKKMKPANKPEEKESESQINMAKNIKWEINDMPMYLPNDFNEEVEKDSNQSYPGNRRSSIAEAFLIGAAERGNNGPSKVNHVLEQTSVADFLRLLSSVETARVGDNNNDKNLSLLSVFSESNDHLTVKSDNMSRRFSQAPVKHQLQPRTRRYSQFSDSIASSHGSLISPRRRKFSHVPSLVGSLSSVAEDRTDSFLNDRLLPQRGELKQRNRPKDTPTLVITPPEKTHRFNVTTTPEAQVPSSSKTSSDDSLDEVVIRL